MTSAGALIEHAGEDGLMLQLAEAGNLKVIGPIDTVNRWLPTLRVRKRDLVGSLRVEARYVFHERAAIMEYDGGLPRDEAERLAARPMPEGSKLKP